MQTAKQFSVRLVNKPGRLSSVLSGLAREKVDLVALSVMDAGERSTLRFVPDDPALARSALETLQTEFETADVLVVEISGRNGAFRHICERLASEHLNVDYAYGSCSQLGGRGQTCAVVKVNDLAKAQRVLGEARARNGRAKPVGRRPKERRPMLAR